MKTAYLGIDPGVNGCAALVFKNGYLLHDYQSARASSKTLKQWKKDYRIKLAVLEKIHIYTKKEKKGKEHRLSAKAILKLPCTFGEWRGILATLDIDFIEKYPQQWQKILIMDPHHGTKVRSLISAKQYFPEAAEKHLKRKKDHDRADALNMAKFATIISGDNF